MSVTYPADPLKPYGDRAETNPNAEGASGEPFIPVYARTGKSARRKGGKIRTWMILTPVGVLVLAGLGAVAMGGGDETMVPLAEPAATAPVVSATPLSAPVVSAATPAPVVQPAPVLRPATPVRRAAEVPAPVRRATPASRAATAPAPVGRASTPVPAPSSTPMLNAMPVAPAAAATPAPTAAPTPAPIPAQPPAPVIIVEPLG